MKYTAEELYQWGMEHGYQEKMEQALYFNDKGFVTRPLKGELVKKDNQFYYVAKIHDDFTVEEPIGNGAEEQNKVLEKVKLHPEVMQVAIVAYDKKYRLRFAFAETEEERKTQLNEKLILDMFRILELDTTGKLKKLVEDSNGVKATRQALGVIGQGLMKDKENS